MVVVADGWFVGSMMNSIRFPLNKVFTFFLCQFSTAVALTAPPPPPWAGAFADATTAIHRHQQCCVPVMEYRNGVLLHWQTDNAAPHPLLAGVWCLQFHLAGGGGGAQSVSKL